MPRAKNKKSSSGKSSRTTSTATGSSASSSGRPSPKREAVLSIGLDKPTAEIVALLKEKGMNVSATYVDLLRKAPSSGAKAGKPAQVKSEGKKSTGGGSAAKPAKSASGTMSKSALIRSMPNASAAEIVAAAKARGLEFGEKYVSTIRYNQRKAGKTGAKQSSAAPKAAAPKAAAAVTRRGPGRPKKASAPVRGTSASSSQGDAEKALRAAATSVVLSHGIEFAQSVLDGVVSRILSAGNG